ncbi:hypothetical protein [Streptomyces gibsoniae]|uniref:Uncharacterized protein n=1 Tax=Streptomyces gibsoniae TaxID=3075529 RepID=A0ABU2U4J3_9ACTN|nr:hypothetical protein [Streptomyces sp. DSM 41699]MDT0468154.1 hypothetical protein [Streptomyces sp. DSM 41699]
MRTAHLDGWSFAALAREQGVSRGAVRTAVVDLMPEHTAADHETTPPPEPPATLDLSGKAAGFLRAAEPDDAERAALGIRRPSACPCPWRAHPLRAHQGAAAKALRALRVRDEGG